MSRGLLLALALLLGACAGPRGEEACGPGLERWTMTELFLGLNRPDGGAVSEAEFRDFVDREVAPRWPEGFTIATSEGAWRSTATGATIREPSRVLRRLRKEGRENEAAIAAIVAAYKTRFAQEAVLRVDGSVCAAF